MKNWKWDKILLKVIVNIFILYMFFNFYIRQGLYLGENAFVAYSLDNIARALLVVGTIAVIAYYNKE
jgi:hypothetical protein